MRRRRNQSSTTIVVLLLIVAVVGIVLYLRQNQSSGGTTGGNNPALSGSVGKPAPIAQVFMGCPPSGDGGDPVLNTLKNRIDEGQWSQSTVAGILTLTWPKAIE